MIGIELTEQERIDLKRLHKKGLPAREADKIKAILMLAKGYDCKETAEVLLLDEDTITNWKVRFLTRQKSVDWLKDDYAGYQGKLTEFEKEEVCSFIDENIVSNCKMVIVFLKDQFGKDYSHSGIQQLLHSLGYVYKFTKQIPSKMDAKKQSEFKEYYEEFRKNLTENQLILFGDSVHPQHNTSATKVWIKKGEEKLIPSNTGRDRINISGFYEPESADLTYSETETVNSDSFIKLLSKVEKKYPEKELINLIIDNSKVHYSKLVQAYLKEHPKIRLIFIPPYSPNLNLIERLWKFLRKKKINTTYYEKLKDFRENILDFLDNLHLCSEEVRKFVGTKLHLIQPLPT